MATGLPIARDVPCPELMVPSVLVRCVHGSRRSGRTVPASASLLLWATLGCHHSATAPAAATGTGVLIVAVERPAETLPTVSVTGPNGFVTSFTRTDTLGSLVAGTYVVSTTDIEASDPIVGALYTSTVAGSPAAVANDDTARVTVSFAIQPGTGGLWVLSGNGGAPVAAEYTGANLLNHAPASVTVPVSTGVGVFDASGNLWVANPAANTLSEYLAATLVAGATPAAAVTIGGPGLSGPAGLAFDRVGDLWVANAANNTVVQLSAAQLASSGTPAPAITLSGAALSGPAGISFDVSGDLWVPNAGSNTVVEYAPAQLAAGGSPAPALAFADTAGSLDGPHGLAFDTQGNLWVANFSGNTIVEYGVSQVRQGGAVPPIATVTMAPADPGPAALAFDVSGDLWALTITNGNVVEYTASQLTASATSAPDLTVAVAAGPASLAFNPPPDGLPLVGPETMRVASRAVRARHGPP